MTHYLSPGSYLNGFADPDWYVDNIPFLDVPDALTNSHIGPVYYYRFSTLKRALRYTDPTNGYVFLECLEPPGYFQLLESFERGRQPLPKGQRVLHVLGR